MMGGMSLLASWTRGEHSADAVTHPTYTKGSGTGVIVIHEIPGMTPQVIGFAEEVVARGHTVVMPQLFGGPEVGMGPRAANGPGTAASSRPGWSRPRPAW